MAQTPKEKLRLGISPIVTFCDYSIQYLCFYPKINMVDTVKLVVSSQVRTIRERDLKFHPLFSAL